MFERLCDAGDQHVRRFFGRRLATLKASTRVVNSCSPSSTVGSVRPLSYNTRTKHDLSDRQREVLGMIASGKTNREIAEALDITLDGAKFHVSEILRKLDVDSREEAAAWWKQNRSPRERMPGWIVWPLATGLGGVAAAGVIVLMIVVFNSSEDPATGPASVGPGPTPTEEVTQFTILDWATFVKFDGVAYNAVEQGAPGGIPLGPQYRQVEVEMPSTIEGPWDPSLPAPDGSAAHMPVGTWVYEVEGYSPRFRLAAPVRGQMRLFHVVDNPHASTGRDLLDINGRVDSIIIWRDVERHEAGVKRIDDPVEVERLVEMVLLAPTGAPPRNSADDWRPIAFGLRDGSRFEATFSPSSNYLAPGLSMPPEFSSMIETLAPP